MFSRPSISAAIRSSKRRTRFSSHRRRQPAAGAARGHVNILDFFDRNEFTSDTRQMFFNLAFMTYSSYDFASDARGYSWGGVAELFLDDWALRFARITPPKNPNGLPNEMRFWQWYGDQVELEHKHEILGRPGTVRLLGYWNRGLVGRFDDAIAALQADRARTRRIAEISTTTARRT